MTLAKLLFLFLTTQLAYAQSPRPVFEVATVKLAAPNTDGHTHINYPKNDNFSATNITLLALMEWAYAMPERQILDGPPWIAATRFDIQAKSEIGDTLKGLPSDQSNELKRQMVRNLLADRFQLKVHEEKRTMPAYDLILAKGGFKLEPSQSNGKSIGTGRNHFNGQGLTMTLIAEELSKIAGRVVVDKTGLTDRYDLALRWTSDDAVASETDPPTLFTAIQEQLGLKLEAAKEPVSVIVIDHVEQSSPN
jgi:uncharacterized protein (TIGR03435 family)